MSTYQFQMAADESHAVVLVSGNAVGTIQNNPMYLGGGLNFAQDSSRHGSPLPKVDEGMWDEFYDWSDGLADKPAAQANERPLSEEHEQD